MHTFHIHITGLVQGVGFRPAVFRIAEKLDIKGWVSNEKDGVHIEFNAPRDLAQQFYQLIISQPPPNAIIVSHSLEKVAPCTYSEFSIADQSSNCRPSQLLAPDYAICESCRAEITDRSDIRHHYPFTTCVNCGPRYSIMRALPYEREFTAMRELEMCDRCKHEFHDARNRRHYSQTNSCPHCTIPMHLYNSSGQLLCNEPGSILRVLNQLLAEGSIAAVKGIGGYLLLCDATSSKTISRLRQRKQRPAKPLALMYSTCENAKQDLVITPAEEALLKSRIGPIVLCKLKEDRVNNIPADLIAPGLNQVGWMLPCSPLLQLIATAFARPLVATSGNISGSPIIYEDEEALRSLSTIADYLITYDREIVVPQDDSVVQVSSSGRKIILRRSRGMAPNHFPHPFNKINYTILATGAELKNAFAIHDHDRLYVSQFLGNQANLLSQQALSHTVDHLLDMLQAKPALILADKHPGYFVTAYARQKAAEEDIPVIFIQHHEAHFGAVLAENNILNSHRHVMGVVWDGTGYGNDGQVWGGEFFLYRHNIIQRIAHLEYFPQLLGDKMSREPRLSALSLLSAVPGGAENVATLFSEREWQLYRRLIGQSPTLFTSSMGRFLDGVAAILGFCSINTYEGEAAMRLEAAAGRYTNVIHEYYPMPIRNDSIGTSEMLKGILSDLQSGLSKDLIAKKIFHSLAWMIGDVAARFAAGEIAFSGGVFQNALLSDEVEQRLTSPNYKLYWHRELSPNDECIGFGQLACFHHIRGQQTELENEKEPATMTQSS